MTPKRNGEFGDGSAPVTAKLDVDLKQFRVVLLDGTEVYVQAFRLFTSFDANLGLVVRALRQDDSEVGVFYKPQGWVLINPAQWVTTP